MRQCSKCGGPMPPQAPGPGRPRSKCDRCAGRKPAEGTVVVLPPRTDDNPFQGLLATTRERLEAVGRDGTVAGAAAIHAAMLLEMGGHTASGAAALLKELRAANEEATKNASAGEDLVDELKRRRQARLSG
jgi:hypothetical protein